MVSSIAMAKSFIHTQLNGFKYCYGKEFDSHTVRWFQVLLWQRVLFTHSKMFLSIAMAKSFIHTQLSGFKHCCLTLIILFDLFYSFAHN